MKGNIKPDAKWRRIVAKMPPLRKRQTGMPYSYENDDVMRWFASQPDLVNVVVDKACGAGLIVYDRETGMWKGRDA